MVYKCKFKTIGGNILIVFVIMALLSLNNWVLALTLFITTLLFYLILVIWNGFTIKIEVPVQGNELMVHSISFSGYTINKIQIPSQSKAKFVKAVGPRGIPVRHFIISFNDQIIYKSVVGSSGFESDSFVDICTDLKIEISK